MNDPMEQGPRSIMKKRWGYIETVPIVRQVASHIPHFMHVSVGATSCDGSICTPLQSTGDRGQRIRHFGLGPLFSCAGTWALVRLDERSQMQRSNARTHIRTMFYIFTCPLHHYPQIHLPLPGSGIRWPCMPVNRLSTVLLLFSTVLYCFAITSSISGTSIMYMWPEQEDQRGVNAVLT